eukprot:Gb_10678 [translate_table: standard]
MSQKYCRRLLAAMDLIIPTIVIAISFLSITSIPQAEALNIGLGPVNVTTAPRYILSEYIATDFNFQLKFAPLLRYGKYCGLGYSGCPGEVPCDGLDACCKVHDSCVQVNNGDYLSQSCSKSFLDCITNFIASGAPSFEGNSCDIRLVTDLIYDVIEAALWAGRTFHDP